MSTSFSKKNKIAELKEKEMKLRWVQLQSLALFLIVTILSFIICIMLSSGPNQNENLSSERFRVPAISITIIILFFCNDFIWEVALAGGNSQFSLGHIIVGALLVYAVLMGFYSIFYITHMQNMKIFWSLWNVSLYATGWCALQFIYLKSEGPSNNLFISVTASILLSAITITRCFSSNAFDMVPVCLDIVFSLFQAVRTAIYYTYMLKRKGAKWSLEEWCCLIYGSATVLASLSTVIISLSSFSTSLSNLSSVSLSGHFYISYVYIIVLYCVRMRFRYVEVAASQKFVLEIKKSFVRFMSHEIRTPLQVLSLGLRLLEERMLVRQLKKIYPIQETILSQKDGEGENSVEHTGISALSSSAALRDVLTGCVEQIKSVHQVLVESSEACSGACSILDSLLHFNEYGNSSRRSMKTLELSVHDIYSLVRESVKAFKLYARACGISLCLDDFPITSAPMHVRVDKPKILKVIGNLISNAIKFSSRGSMVSVDVSLDTGGNSRDNSPRSQRSPRGPLSPRDLQRSVGIGASSSRLTNGMKISDRVRVNVTDHGPGISSEDQKKLFKSVVQFNVNSLQKGGGSGIGLVTSYEIARKHNGTLGVFSKGEGHGSTFWLELPLISVHIINNVISKHMSVNDYRLLQSISPRRQSFGFSRSLDSLKLRILVVDDSLSARKLTKRVLVESGFCERVDVAEDGVVALEKIYNSMELNEPYHLVLMDYLMPHMDGPTTAKRAREAGFKGVIYGVTGNGVEEDMAHFKSSGVTQVYLKPLTTDIILNMVSTLPTTESDNPPCQSAGNSSKKDPFVPLSESGYIYICSVCAIIIPLIFTVKIEPFTKEVAISQNISRNIYFWSSVVVSLTVSLYVFLEGILHSGLGYSGMQGLLFIAPVLIFHDIFMLAYVIPYDDVDTLWYLLNTRDVLVFAAAQLYGIRDSALRSCIVVSLGCTGFLFRTWSLGFLQLQNVWGVASIVLLACVVLLMMLQGTRFFRDVCREGDYSLEISLAFVVIGIVGSIVIGVIGAEQVWSPHSDLYKPVSISSLAAYNFLFLACVSIISLIQVRVAAYLALCELDIARSKSNIVRYIAHEMRTPLNVISMGLEYMLSTVIPNLQDSLGELKVMVIADGSSDSVFSVIEGCRAALSDDLVEVIDLEKSCADAVCVLDDLLNYEKLDGNLLEMDIADENVIEVVEDFCSLIKKRMELDSGSEIPPLSLLIDDKLHTSKFVVDRFKILYALKNVFLNIFKFPPDGAEIIMDIKVVTSGFMTDKAWDRKDGEKDKSSSVIKRHSLGKVMPLVLPNRQEYVRFWILKKTTSGQKSVDHILAPGILNGDFKHSLSLYVADGIIKLHQGKMMSNYRSDGVLKQDLEFVIDIPLKQLSNSPRASIVMPQQQRCDSKEFPAVSFIKSLGGSRQSSKRIGGGSNVGSRKGLKSDSSPQYPPRRRGSFFASVANEQQLVEGSAPLVASTSDLGLLRSASPVPLAPVPEIDGPSFSLSNKGLGLYSLPNIGEEKHQGSVWGVVLGQGALPQGPSGGQTEEGGGSRKGRGSSKGQKSHREGGSVRLNLSRVLVVDDVASVRKMMERVLVGNGVCDKDALFMADDGDQAVQMIKDSMAAGTPYDVVLMDFMMPRMDGPTATKLAREAGFTGVIIGATGNALDEDVKRFRSSGANEVLVKPINMQNLKRLLTSYRTK